MRFSFGHSNRNLLSQKSILTEPTLTQSTLTQSTLHISICLLYISTRPLNPIIYFGTQITTEQYDPKRQSPSTSHGTGRCLDIRIGDIVGTHRIVE